MERGKQNYTDMVLKADDMDIKSKLFGVRFVDGGSPNGLVELYIEDDENYHLKASFNYFWLDDFLDIIRRARKHAPRDFKESSATETEQ